MTTSPRVSECREAPEESLFLTGTRGAVGLSCAGRGMGMATLGQQEEQARFVPYYISSATLS